MQVSFTNDLLNFFRCDKVEPLKLNLLSGGVVLVLFNLPFLAPHPLLFTIALLSASIGAYIFSNKNPMQCWGIVRFSFKWLFVSLCLYPILIPFIVLASMTSDWLCHLLNIPVEPQEMMKIFLGLKNVEQIFWFVTMAVLIAPVTEEVFFRGFLYPWMKSWLPRWGASVVSSLIFAAVHFHFPTLLPLALLGFALAWLYEFTGSLWSNIIFHALFNSVTLVVVWYFPNLIT